MNGLVQGIVQVFKQILGRDPRTVLLLGTNRPVVPIDRNEDPG
jgi:hypothetical protein